MTFFIPSSRDLKNPITVFCTAGICQIAFTNSMTFTITSAIIFANPLIALPIASCSLHQSLSATSPSPTTAVKSNKLSQVIPKASATARTTLDANWKVAPKVFLNTNPIKSIAANKPLNVLVSFSAFSSLITKCSDRSCKNTKTDVKEFFSKGVKASSKASLNDLITVLAPFTTLLKVSNIKKLFEGLFKESNNSFIDVPDFSASLANSPSKFICFSV